MSVTENLSLNKKDELNQMVKIISVAPMMDWTSEILFIFQIKNLLKNFKILGVK